MPLRSALRVRPVNSIKHVVDTATSVVLAVTSVVPIIEAVDAPVLSNVQQIEGGSVINAIYLRCEVLGTGVYAGVPRVYFTVQKNPGGNLAFVQPNSVGGSDNKKFVIHQEMTMIHNAGADGAGFPRTMFQGVVKIPSRYRRFGVRDTMIVAFQNGSGETSGIANVCVQAIYKEFR